MMTYLPLLRRFWWVPIMLVLVALWRWEAGRAEDEANARKQDAAEHDAAIARISATMDAARAADALNARRVAAQQERISDEVRENYQSRIADLRARAASLRREPPAASGGSGTAPVPGIPDAAGRIDAAAGDSGLSSDERLIASEQAERLIALQQWVRDVAAVPVNNEEETGNE